MSEEQGTATPATEVVTPTPAPAASQVEETTTPPPAVEEAPKPEKTEEQRAIERMQRGIDRKTRQAAEARARADHAERRLAELEARLTPPKTGVDFGSESDADSRLTLTPAEFAQRVEEEAKKLAPSIAKQVASEEQIRSAASALKQELGDEKFAELTGELSDIFPAEKQLALLFSKSPASLVRYLADPDNETEAKRIAAMSDFQAGTAVHALEIKLAQKVEKPKASKAAEPLEEIKAEGSTNSAPDPIKNPKAWRAWANKAEARTR